MVGKKRKICFRSDGSASFLNCFFSCWNNLTDFPPINCRKDTPDSLTNSVCERLNFVCESNLLFIQNFVKFFNNFFPIHSDP